MAKKLHLDLIIGSVYRNYPLACILPFVLLTAASLFLLPRVRAGGTLFIELPEDDAYTMLSSSVEKRFDSSEFLLLSVRGRGLEDEEALGLLAELCDRLVEFPQVESVMSVTTLNDMVVTDGELRFVPLYLPPDGPDTTRSSGDDAVTSTPEELVNHVSDTRIFREYLLSEDGTAWNVYLFLAPGIDRTATGRILFEELERLSGETPHIRTTLFGNVVLEYLAIRGILRDFYRIGLVALGGILLMELVITGSAVTGFLLWIASTLPAIWITALFPLLGLRLEIPSVMAPVIVLILSTTYSIHLYRYYSLTPGGRMETTLSYAGPVILTAAATTMFGFLSLAASPLPGLRELSVPLIIGIALAALSAVFLMPYILVLARRFIRPRTIGLPFPWSWRCKGILLAAFLLILVVAGFSSTRVGTDFRLDVRFTRWSETGRLLDSFYEINGGMDDLDLVIDTGSEYGLVDPERFRGLTTLTRRLNRIDGVNRVVSYVDFILWANDRLENRSTEAENPAIFPEDEYALGETMELFYGSDTGIGIDSLLDPEYRRCRIQVRFGKRAADVAEAQELYARIRSEIDEGMRELLPGVDYRVLGLPVRYAVTMEHVLRGLGYSLLVFFPLLGGLLMFLFRSVKWAAYALVPPVFSLIFYFGFLGITGISLNTASAFMTAAVLGVTNDDVLCFLLFLRRERLAGVPPEAALERTMRETGTAIIFTSVIIILGLAALLTSEYPTIIHATAAVMVTFAVCTLVTLVVIPILVAAEKNRTDERESTIDMESD